MTKYQKGWRQINNRPNTKVGWLIKTLTWILFPKEI